MHSTLPALRSSTTLLRIHITKPWHGVPQRKHISGTARQDLHSWRYKDLFNLRRVHVVSDAFKSKMQPARHRMVYAILREELDREGGIHALQLRTKTPEEAENQQFERKDDSL
jgi:stress-induced morphogen